MPFFTCAVGPEACVGAQLAMLANKPKANVVLLSIVKAAYERNDGRGVHDSGST